jgi:hypothetical protein
MHPQRSGLAWYPQGLAAAQPATLLTSPATRWYDHNIVWWLGCCALLVVLDIAFAAGYRAQAPAPVTPVSLPAGPPAPHAAPDAPLPAALHAFALNALLVPLLDDAVPPRWTDVSIAYGCAPGTHVLVNGQPLVDGQPMPATTFTVQWTMNRCQPLGPDAVELSGRVDLQVFHEDDGLSAIVTPQRLRVDSALGRTWWHASFTAETSLAVQAMR